MKYMYGNMSTLIGMTIVDARIEEHDDTTTPVLILRDKKGQSWGIDCMADDEGNGGGSLHIYEPHELT